MLAEVGWAVQDYEAFEPSISSFFALREFSLKSGHFDYLHLLNRKPVGIVGANKKGYTAYNQDNRLWLKLIHDQITTSCSIELDDLDYTPFNQEGGLGKVHQLFGDQLPKLLEEINKALAV